MSGALSLRRGYVGAHATMDSLVWPDRPASHTREWLVTKQAETWRACWQRYRDGPSVRIDATPVAMT